MFFFSPSNSERLWECDSIYRECATFGDTKRCFRDIFRLGEITQSTIEKQTIHRRIYRNIHDCFTAKMAHSWREHLTVLLLSSLLFEMQMTLEATLDRMHRKQLLTSNRQLITFSPKIGFIISINNSFLPLFFQDFIEHCLLFSRPHRRSVIIRCPQNDGGARLFSCHLNGLWLFFVATACCAAAGRR